jgi:hypothetical protein
MQIVLKKMQGGRLKRSYTRQLKINEIYMYKRNTPVMISLFLMLFACNGNKGSIKQVRDSDLLVQVRQMKGEQDAPNTMDYAVRITPDKKLVAGKEDSFKTSFWYSMDSCFYIMNGNTKVYSAIVQPIANGLTGSFEYMLSFGTNDLKAGNWNLIYEDKYLNHKKYTLNLNKE